MCIIVYLKCVSILKHQYFFGYTYICTYIFIYAQEQCYGGIEKIGTDGIRIKHGTEVRCWYGGAVRGAVR